VSLAEIAIELRVDDAFAERVDVESLTHAAAATLQHQGVDGPAELTIVVTGDGRMRRLNRSFRGVDASTDVLAFQNAEGSGFVTPSEVPRYLGDVIISFPRAEAQAEQAGHAVQTELGLLTIHGVLHLLGHDHAELDQKAVMWAAQEDILRVLSA
jgi:probable rRNA maturation factor